MAVKAAIDIGTSCTRIYALGNGVVLDEPTVVALGINDESNKIKAIGSDAKRLIGKTAENTKVVFPVFEGEVVNEKLTAAMLDAYLKKIRYKQGFSSPITAVSVPCGAEIALVKKLSRVLTAAGVNDACFVEAPLAAAIGQNIALSEATPCFIIDIGGGVTNIAALSLDGIIAGVSVSLGGKNTDVWLIDYIADNYGLQIGLLTAERIKIQIGSLFENDTLSTVVNGRDLATGRPRSIVLRADDVTEPIARLYDKIFEIAGSVLSKLPPEVSAEIRRSGLYISGGGAEIVGLENYYRKKFNMNINVADEPRMCVILGLGAAVGNPDLLKKIKITGD